VAGILGQHDISLVSVLQKARAEREAVPVVLMTHEARERDMRAALALIDRLDVVAGRTTMIRVEDALCPPGEPRPGASPTCADPVHAVAAPTAGPRPGRPRRQCGPTRVPVPRRRLRGDGAAPREHPLELPPRQR